MWVLRRWYADMTYLQQFLAATCWVIILTVNLQVASFMLAHLRGLPYRLTHRMLVLITDVFMVHLEEWKAILARGPGNGVQQILSTC
jgi:hypothetical protein